MNLDNAGPAGAINSSAAEMAKWVLLQLNRGKLPDRDGQLIQRSAITREMWTAQTILPIGELPAPLAALKANFADYALGWSLRDYHGHELVAHTGGVAGMVSRVMLVPDSNLGVVILTNAEQGSAFDSILYHVLDHYLQLPSTDWIAAFEDCEGRSTKGGRRDRTEAECQPKRRIPALPSIREVCRNLQRRLVWHGHNPPGDARLVLSFDHTPAMVGELEHWQYDTFKRTGGIASSPTRL